MGEKGGEAKKKIRMVGFDQVVFLLVPWDWVLQCPACLEMWGLTVVGVCVCVCVMGGSIDTNVFID